MPSQTPRTSDRHRSPPSAAEPADQPPSAADPGDQPPSAADPGDQPPSAPGIGAAASPLPLTGERTVPGVPDERYWFARHLVAYELAAATVAQLRASTVVDAGCGEGYGLALLASAGADRVIGADYDAVTVEHARATYAANDPRIELLHSELLTLPEPDPASDLTVSFQVIEHVYDVRGYLGSLHRVTRPGGQLLLATPNRLTFTPDADAPVNPFHVREFTAAELSDELLAAGFELVEVVGVHHGARLRAAERDHGPGLLERLAGDPDTWPAGLRSLVHRVEPSWFELRTDDLDGSLDLIARCRVPGERPPPARP